MLGMKLLRVCIYKLLNSIWSFLFLIQSAFAVEQELKEFDNTSGYKWFPNLSYIYTSLNRGLWKFHRISYIVFEVYKPWSIFRHCHKGSFFEEVPGEAVPDGHDHVLQGPDWNLDHQWRRPRKFLLKFFWANFVFSVNHFYRPRCLQSLFLAWSQWFVL